MAYNPNHGWNLLSNNKWQSLLREVCPSPLLKFINISITLPSNGYLSERIPSDRFVKNSHFFFPIVKLKTANGNFPSKPVIKNHSHSNGYLSRKFPLEKLDEIPFRWCYFLFTWDFFLKIPGRVIGSLLPFSYHPFLKWKSIEEETISFFPILEVDSQSIIITYILFPRWSVNFTPRNLNTFPSLLAFGVIPQY